MNLLEPEVLVQLGPVPLTRPVVTTWGIMVVVVFACWLGARRPAEVPNRWQVVLELFVETIASQIREVTQRDPKPLLPLVATCFLFLVCANLSAVLPGVQAPTAHLETPAALALVVLFSIHWFGIRARGLVGHLKGYLEPNPALLPLNVLEDFTRIFSMTVRLFGNMMSHELVVGIVVSLAGLLVPVPLMVLAVLVGVIQAYIFTVLATVFLAAAIGVAEREEEVA